MDRHVHFWIGSFVSLLLGIPIALSVIWSLAGRALDLATLSFGALIAILLLCVISLALRDWVLKGLLGSTSAGLIEACDSFGRLILVAAKGNVSEVRDHAVGLSKLLLAWYCWIGFYRWVINAGIALLGAFAIFSGTVLLIDQNQELRRLNSISSEQFKQRLTFEILTSRLMNEFFQSAKSDISAYLQIHEVFPTDFDEDEKATENSLRTVLNYYENVSLHANSNRLDRDVIYDTIGGPMLRTYEATRDRIRARRCRPASISRRKAYEHFEVFAICENKVRNSGRLDQQISNFQICKKRQFDRLNSENYCEE